MTLVDDAPEVATQAPTPAESTDERRPWRSPEIATLGILAVLIVAIAVTFYRVTWSPDANATTAIGICRTSVAFRVHEPRFSNMAYHPNVPNHGFSMVTGTVSTTVDGTRVRRDFACEMVFEASNTWSIASLTGLED